MKCICLAAGYATRLYPLTQNFPKPLLPVGGKPILDWLLEDIEQSGEIDEYIVISNGKFAKHFEKWAENSKLNITVLDDGTFTNETRLGAVKDIQFALEKLKIDDDALIIAGDNVLDFSLCSFISYAKEKNASCIMRYYEPDFAKLLKCGVVETNENDKILSMTEKSPEPKTHWCTPPFYFYKKEDLQKIPEAIACGCSTDAPGSFAAYLAEITDVYAFEMPGRRFDVGNLEGYKKIDEEYKGICKK